MDDPLRAVDETSDDFRHLLVIVEMRHRKARVEAFGLSPLSSLANKLSFLAAGHNEEDEFLISPLAQYEMKKKSVSCVCLYSMML